MRWYYANREKFLAKRKADWPRVRERYNLAKVRQYGLTPDTYKAMLAEQGGVCAICKTAPTSDVRLVVDHDHVTHSVRGLLCHRCNRSLGLLRDDVLVLARAIEYISEWANANAAKVIKDTA